MAYPFYTYAIQLLFVQRFHNPRDILKFGVFF